MKLIYAANARIPSEKAHPYQIMQMCEAFANAGYDVTLLYANRHNPPDLQTGDIWAHYGIEPVFKAERLPCLDLFPLAARLPGRLRGVVERVVALLQLLTFNITLMLRLMREQDAILYSRDHLTLLWIAILWRKRARHAFYEAHVYPSSRVGIGIRKQLAKKLGGFIVITEHLRRRYALLSDALPLLVAHDGIRRARFEIEGDQTYWRNLLGWPEVGFIVGYMGRFYGGMEGMD